jgi:hypothetical protein
MAYNTITVKVTNLTDANIADVASIPSVGSAIRSTEDPNTLVVTVDVLADIKNIASTIAMKFPGQQVSWSNPGKPL